MSICEGNKPVGDVPNRENGGEVSQQIFTQHVHHANGVNKNIVLQSSLADVSNPEEQNPSMSTKHQVSLNIDMLVGLDYYYSFITGKTIRGMPNEPVAIESIFGWIICGPVSTKKRNKNKVVNLVSHERAEINDEDSLRNELKHFWEVESVGCSESNVYEQFKDNIKFVGDRYVTKLPFKPHADVLPDNYKLSLNRLNQLKNRLEKNDTLKKQYQDVISSYENEKIIERVETTGEPGKVCYLPHTAVVRQDKETTKVRVVFDGSAKSSEFPSLNECLYAGPCFDL